MTNKTIRFNLLLLETVYALIIFSVVLYYKSNQFFSTDPLYAKFLLVYCVGLLLTSIYFNKIDILLKGDRKSFFITLILQFLILILLISLIAVFSAFTEISRGFIIVFSATLMTLEIISLIFFKKPNSIKLRKDGLKTTNFERIQPYRVIASLSLLIAPFYLIHFFEFSSFESSKSHELTIISLVVTWVISSILTGKFSPMEGRNYYYKISPFIKSAFLMNLLIGGIFYFGRLDNHLIQFDLFATSILSGFLESLLAIIYFKSRKIQQVEQRVLYSSHFQQSRLDISQNKNSGNTFYDQLSRVSKNDSMIINNSIKSFFKGSPPPEKFNMFFDRSTFNIDIFTDLSLELIMNFCPVNDIPNKDNYFSSCYNVLETNRLIMGFYVPQEHDIKNLRRKMPKYLFSIYYPFRFLFRRIFLKLPYCSIIYSVITKNYTSLISKAELWGRLSYAGFGEINEYPINGEVLFIAKKILTPAKEEHPSYGPIVKLKRLGLNGKTIRIYKLRTMFPYSEFIQQEVFKLHSLDKSGKLKNDFRKNTTGKILRKLWLDELPQLYNWLRGDITLVGVRALSEHYFNLYPEDVKELRLQYKPGLIPPYYADMPNSFDEIVESERQYLFKKIDSPFKTDMIYFWRAIVNIVFKGARSS